MMKPGDVIRTTYFQHHDSRMITSWKAEKGKVFVLILLGTEDKDGPEILDPLDALRDLGWELQDKPE